MRCDECREELSARLDGEADVDQPDVDEHVLACPACQEFASSTARLHRSIRVQSAAPVPDLTAAILAQSPPAGAPAARRVTPEWPRYVLLTVALTQIVLAVPALLLGHDTGASVHVAREMGSWDVALSIGLLVAAWEPRRAAGLLPFAAALAGAMAVTAVLDVAGGRVVAITEAHHVLDLVGLAALWVLARSARPARTRVRRSA